MQLSTQRRQELLQADGAIVRLQGELEEREGVVRKLSRALTGTEQRTMRALQLLQLKAEKTERLMLKYEQRAREAEARATQQRAQASAANSALAAAQEQLAMSASKQQSAQAALDDVRVSAASMRQVTSSVLGISSHERI